MKEAGRYNAALLYTSKNGGTISLDLNGKDARGLIRTESTYNPQDPIALRQWHHWNYANKIATMTLLIGVNVLAIHVVLEGNMNLA